MSVPAAVSKLLTTIDDRIVRVAAFRATVTAVDGSLITVRREGAATANTEKYATISRFLLSVNDVVLCLPLGGRSVVVLDVIRYAVAATPTIAALTAAGSTATASVAGNDTFGAITLDPSGAGITTGNIIDLTWAVAKPSTSYNLLLTPASGAARTLGLVVGRAARTTGKVTIATSVALTTGQTYIWDYRTDQYA